MHITPGRCLDHCRISLSLLIPPAPSQISILSRILVSLESPLLVSTTIASDPYQFFPWNITAGFQRSPCLLSHNTARLPSHPWVSDLLLLKSLLNLLQHCFYFVLWFPGCKASGILVPLPGTEPTPSVFEGEVLTTGPPGKSMSDLFINQLLTPGLLIQGLPCCKHGCGRTGGEGPGKKSHRELPPGSGTESSEGAKQVVLLFSCPLFRNRKTWQLVIGLRAII